MFDLMDEMLAGYFRVSVEDYVKKIESTTPFRMGVIIDGIMSDDIIKQEKAFKIFHLIK